MTSFAEGSRRLQRALRAAALIAGLALAGWVAQRLGASTSRVGVVVGVATIAILGGLLVPVARRAGLSRFEGYTWACALVAATATPLVTAVYPGGLLSRSESLRKGDTLAVGGDRPRAVRVLVAASLPESTPVSFSLRIGREVVEGSLLHGIRRSGLGTERTHSHEYRSSVLVDGELSPGADGVVLERVTVPDIPLRVVVFARAMPSWLPWAAVLATFCGFSWRVRLLAGSRLMITVASVMAVAGLGSAALATPENALGAVTRGALLGLLVGLPVGKGAEALVRRVRLHGR